MNHRQLPSPDLHQAAAVSRNGIRMVKGACCNGGTGCSFCISACPYNKLDTWIHDTAKLLTGIPVGRDIARQLDDAFGYGEKTAAAAQAFWDKEV